MGGKSTPPPPPQQTFDPSMFAFPAMHMAGPSQETLEQQRRQQQEELRRQEEERAKAEGLRERDSMYSSYLDAAGSATDYINNEIAREAANAKLLGIDYDVSQEQKDRRVSDYFATVWGEGEQTQLETLFDKWGKPEGFESFSVTRGDASKYSGTPGEEKTVGVGGGQKPRPTLATDEDEALGNAGGASTVLGV